MKVKIELPMTASELAGVLLALGKERELHVIGQRSGYGPTEVHELLVTDGETDEDP